jgi:hypothetical protein
VLGTVPLGGLQICDRRWQRRAGPRCVRAQDADARGDGSRSRCPGSQRRDFYRLVRSPPATAHRTGSLRWDGRGGARPRRVDAYQLGRRLLGRSMAAQYWVDPLPPWPRRSWRARLGSGRLDCMPCGCSTDQGG